MPQIDGSTRPSVPENLPFPIPEYRQRQARVRDALAARGIDLLYITSPANLFYLTGYEALWYPSRLPLGAVIAREHPEVLFLDWSRHAAYVGTRVLCEQVLLMDYENAPDTAARALAQYGSISKVIGIEWCTPNPSAPVMSSLADRLRSHGANVVAGDWIVDQIRLYKSAAEVDRIRKAAAIADAAMLDLQRSLRPGLTELDVSALLSTLLATHGSEIAAMPPMVNSGPTAWLDTHSFPTRRRLEAGDTVSIDCCAVVDRYHANLGRTFAIGTRNSRAMDILNWASGSILALKRAARIGDGPQTALSVADRHVRERVLAENIWWIGGYSLGIAFPPSWVGHVYLANDGVEKCLWQSGFVSNYENIFIDQTEGFEAAYIDTVVMTDEGAEILSNIPRGLQAGGY